MRSAECSECRYAVTLYGRLELDLEINKIDER